MFASGPDVGYCVCRRLACFYSRGHGTESIAPMHRLTFLRFSLVVAACCAAAAVHAQNPYTRARSYIYGRDTAGGTIPNGSGVATILDDKQNAADIVSNVNVYTPSSSFAQTTSASNGTGLSQSSATAGSLKNYARTTFPPVDLVDYIASESTASVYDKGIVTAPGLSFGDPVSLLITLNIDGLITPDPASYGFTGGYSYMLASVRVFNPSNFSLPRLDLAFEWSNIRHTAHVLTGVYNTTVGAEMGMTLSANANTYISGVTRPSSAEVAFGSTSHLYIDGAGATPDAAFSSPTTGFNYASPVVVPEAGTAGLVLGVGCWVLGAVAVRRRSIPGNAVRARRFFLVGIRQGESEFRTIRVAEKYAPFLY